MVMSYIIVLNAVIITGGAQIAGLNVSFPAVVTSTCLVAGLMCAAMGLYANLPFALAPGMGLNAVVAFQLMVGMRYSFAEAMGVIFLEGIIITLLVITGLRQAVLRALPVPLKLAIGAGIGLFLFAIGAYEAGLFVVPLGATQGGTVQPPTAGALGNFTSPATALRRLRADRDGRLMHLRVKGALLLGILLTTVVGLVVHLALRVPLSIIPGKLELPPQIVSIPDFQYVGSGVVGLSFLTRGGFDALLAGPAGDPLDHVERLLRHGRHVHGARHRGRPGRRRRQPARERGPSLPRGLAGGDGRRRWPARPARRRTSRAAPASPRAAEPV